MSNKYRLKRELPGIPVGSTLNWGIAGFSFTNKDEDRWTLPGLNPKMTDWVEPVEEGPWKPEDGERVWLVTHDLRVSDASFSYYVCSGYDARLNIFKTREAAQAVADCFKAVLEYVHAPKPTLSEYERCLSLLSQARDIVQETQGGGDA